MSSGSTPSLKPGVCVAGVSHHAVRLLLNNSDALLSHSYEFMRKNLIHYRTEIHRLTGEVRVAVN